MDIFYNTAAAEEVPTGRLNWFKEQVVTHQAGERKKEVHRELLGDQLSTQVVFLAVGDVPHPVLSLGAGFLPGPEHRSMMTVSKWSQSSPLTNDNAVAVVPPGLFCQALGSGNGFPPLSPSPLE